MDLSTNYLGLKLTHPFMPGASPLSGSLDTVRRLEDAGASAIVMHSLFEEELLGKQAAAQKAQMMQQHTSAEAPNYLPGLEWMVLGPQEYLEQIRQIKAAVKVPVIASINGVTPGGWIDYARQMESAGADALELNVYFVPTDKRETAETVEQRMVTVLKDVKKTVRIPVAVKLLPFHTALPNLATRLGEAGADGLVLFNRVYQPDINVEELEVKRTLPLSSSSDLPIRLMGLSILSGRVRPSLAVSGGVHTVVDAVKAIMCGAHAVQMVSALWVHGPRHLAEIRNGVAEWLEKHDYTSLQQMLGSMGLDRCPDPTVYDRTQYIKTLHSAR